MQRDFAPDRSRIRRNAAIPTARVPLGDGARGRSRHRLARLDSSNPSASLYTTPPSALTTSWRCASAIPVVHTSSSIASLHRTH